MCMVNNRLLGGLLLGLYDSLKHCFQNEDSSLFNCSQSISLQQTNIFLPLSIFFCKLVSESQFKTFFWGLEPRCSYLISTTFPRELSCAPRIQFKHHASTSKSILMTSSGLYVYLHSIHLIIHLHKHKNNTHRNMHK